MLVAAERPAGPAPRIRMSAWKGGAISDVFGFRVMILVEDVYKEREMIDVKNEFGGNGKK